MRTILSLCVAAGAFPLLLPAVHTQHWVQNQRDDFNKGSLKKISLRSDGRLSLAPTVKELFDPSTAYLWAIAENSKGTIYIGGGGPGTASARLFEVSPDGKGKVLAELPGLEIHAIAIDRQDRVYAATSPDGKIYRIGAKGSADLFYDPKAKYIWSMAFSSRGDLFVATGDEGEIHRVTPDGKGSVFYRTDETHARSMAIDSKDNIIVGTEPGGLVLRISPAGEGFVLYQAAKREVTAVAVRPDGVIYAAAVGTQPAPVRPPAAAPAKPAATATVTTASTTGAQPSRSAPQPPALSPAAIGAVSGGSEVYRIEADGLPHRVWKDDQEIVYALEFDREGRPLLGTGNNGSVYRLDSDILSTLLFSASPTQITGFAASRTGGVLAVTGNVGMLYRIGPGIEPQGTFESDVFDAGHFSNWGRLSWKGEAAGGKIAFETRSGNLDRPQKSWSAWAPVSGQGGGRISSPPARFLQWRVTMTAGPKDSSPSLSMVEVAYLMRNVPPVVSLIELTPPNYAFPPQTLSITPATSITLPALGSRQTRSRSSTSSTSSSTDTMQYAKGHAGARWRAEDSNDDDLIYKVEIRGVGERDWKLLKDKLEQSGYTFDSRAFADGEYVLRVTASDARDNPPDRAAEAALESEPFLIDNTAPQITGLTAVRQGNLINVQWKAADATSALDRAEYSVNGGEWTRVDPRTGITDSQTHDFALALENKGSGEVTISVRVTDRFDNQAVATVVVR